MNKNGFTLIEVLTAGAIFILALSFFSLTFKAGSNYFMFAKERIRGMLEARSEMESLKQASFDQLSSFNMLNFANGKGEVTVQTLSADILLINLKYRWRWNRPPIELDALKGRI